MSHDNPIRISIPVTLLLERRMISRSFWSMPSWYLHTVAVGEHVAMGGSAVESGAPAGQSDKGELFVWTGHHVTLYRDACERYWHALIGDKPLVYVVCREGDGVGDDATGLRPVIATIDYDEATAIMENEGLVLCGPIPPELYRHMEAFVLQHYKPKAFKKRKRNKWSDDPFQNMNLITPDGSGMNERKDSGSFLNRWSARKQQSAVQVTDDDNVPETGAESDLPDATDLADMLPGGMVQDELSRNAPESTEPTTERAAKTRDDTELQSQDLVSVEERHALLTDADMPDVDTLTARSDISGFLGKGVSAALRKAALRHVFRQPEYNVRDGLDDYDDDYTSFEPLGDTVTCDMKYHTARKERARLASERLAQEQTHEGLDVPDHIETAQDETATIDDKSSGELAEEKIDADHEATTDDDQERHSTVSAGKDEDGRNADPFLEHLPDQCPETDTPLNKTSQARASQPGETPNE